MNEYGDLSKRNKARESDLGKELIEELRVSQKLRDYTDKLIEYLDHIDDRSMRLNQSRGTVSPECAGIQASKEALQKMLTRALAPKEKE